MKKGILFLAFLNLACAVSFAQSNEMSPEEILKSLSTPGDNIAPSFPEDFLFASPSSRARRSRPASPPAGALYMDVYQESPVLIDYKGNGNLITPMSFAVVYKFIKNENGMVIPHFVRAHLVSTGAEGHRTPVGDFDIDRRYRYYTSQTYNSEMNFAQFFIGGVAIHETPVENYPILGGPASHGCVRQHRKDAEAMWNLIGSEISAKSMINIKVYPFSREVILADGSSGRDTYGFGQMLNQWLNRSIACTRRGQSSRCSTSWNPW